MSGKSASTSQHECLCFVRATKAPHTLQASSHFTARHFKGLKSTGLISKGGPLPNTDQSTSLSWPFFTPSEHVGALHTPPVHTPLVQSLGRTHFLPAAHAPQVLPPLCARAGADKGDATHVESATS